MADKPKFVFFKMLACGHCVSFYEQPEREKSVWAQLVRDKDLSAKVNFELREWGWGQDAEGNRVMHKLPEEYKFVNYGPYFYLQNGLDSTQGFEMKDVVRTFDAMKAWILNKCNTEPKLVAKPVARNNSAPVQPTVQQSPNIVSSGLKANSAPPQIVMQPATGQKPAPAHILQMREQAAQQRAAVQASQQQQQQQHQQQAPTQYQVQQAPVHSQPMQPQVQATMPSPKAEADDGRNVVNRGSVIRQNIIQKSTEAPVGRKFVSRNRRRNGH
jgi:hypothetical protein